MFLVGGYWTFGRTGPRSELYELKTPSRVKRKVLSVCDLVDQAAVAGVPESSENLFRGISLVRVLLRLTRACEC